MKKIAILLGAIALSASMLAANTASISVTGTATTGNPTLVCASEAWNMGSIIVGQPFSIGWTSTLTLTTPNQVLSQNDITLSIAVSGEWKGISTLDVSDDTLTITPVTVSTSTAGTDINTTYRGATGDGTGYFFTIIPSEGSVATSAGSISGTITFTAVYTA